MLLSATVPEEVQLLAKRFGLPAACVDNTAAGKKAGMHQKKEKAATNVRRA